MEIEIFCPTENKMKLHNFVLCIINTENHASSSSSSFENDLVTLNIAVVVVVVVCVS